MLLALLEPLISLVGISDINAVFLEQMQNIIGNFETSDAFLTFRNQFQQTCASDRPSLKEIQVEGIN